MQTEDHLNQVVQNIVGQVTTQVNVQVAAAIDQKIAELINNIDITDMVAKQLNAKLDVKVNQLPINQNTIERELAQRLEGISTNLSQNVQAASAAAIAEAVKVQVNRVDYDAMLQTAIAKTFSNQHFDFPESSIPAAALDINGLSISGNQIRGGIVKNFGSTGIDDRATQCQLTVLDEAIVVENNLLTNDLTVKGTTHLEGDVVITGRVPTDTPFFASLVNSVTAGVQSGVNQSMFQGFSDLIFTRIRESGIDLDRITIQGQEIINSNTLGSVVVNSNLQRVGVLKELQTTGETFLSQTLYATESRRVGINTIEPTQALSIWDQEVEIGIGKQGTNTAVIEAPRNQTLVIGANGNKNIVVMPNGSVAMRSLELGSVTLSSSSTPPSDNRPAGSIVFNANPTLGGPLGWVSLGGARWANFGFID
jgi:hypothetical protein